MKDKIIRIVLVLVGLGVIGWCIYVGMQVGKRQTSTLTIVHVNDTHSHLEAEKTHYAGMGGVLERAAYIDSVRKADGKENVLLIHAGDFCQGTSYFTEFGGKVEVGLLNTLEYDVVTLGNHEFDNGIEALGELLSHLKAPVVVCNYDFSPFEAGKYIKPYVIVERAGKKIGIVGVLCGLKDMVAGDIANRIPEFDMVSTVQKYVDEIRPQVDYVIALTHIGYTEHNPGDTTDPKLCAATRDIDLFISGHSHTFMEEPAYQTNLDGKKIPIVQVGWMGVNMGEAHITF
jgi:5'-nucleotidase